MAALVAVNAAASLALPPMNCNSFGCYPVGVNPGGGTARDEPRTGPTPTPTLTPAAAAAAAAPARVGRPPAIEAESSPRALKTARALRRNKAVMYGAYWCGFCNKERQELGKEAHLDRVSRSDYKQGPSFPDS